VLPSATPEELRAAYRAACRRFHPDVVGDTPEANAHFRAVLDAYRSLLEPRSGRGCDGDTMPHARRPVRAEDWLYPREPSVDDLASDTRSDAEMRHAGEVWMRYEAARRAEREAARRAERGARVVVDRAREAPSSGADAMSMMAVALACAFCLFSAGDLEASANGGRKVGAPATDSCRQRGGGLCRFL
jgi:hypothetical protein